ncbi:aminomethyl-transferring glycine dehydrogenase [Flaviflexus equikiangi]|uniref:Glycine dehydrogenase (decarboxylating) n=1 Tax=Flaviflexus equikiangi TaxID=2758573 RepID=A0ABS2TFY6_9ACTO|nr:aminomethyl-transferring glycine dehydrogenase [Flaviflexus equikiangi]MBM9433278.1 aminomethyl-transferring glycine dehydrogenase [Flaviflexus equikiangi]
MTSFVPRHVGTWGSDREDMLAAVGVASLDELTDVALPAGLSRHAIEGLPQGRSEQEVLDRLAELASRNTVRTSMIGQGYYDTVTPSVIRRNILENPSWYTAYTPYQPEISQGRLEALVTFQTVVSDLTGMDIANASMLDEATAVAEAVLLATRVTKKRSTVLVSPDIFDATRAVLDTRADALKITLEDLDAATIDSDVAAVVIQYPGASGHVPDLSELTELVDRAHEAGALVIVAADLLALTLLASPGSWGADIVAGTTQRFGVPMSGGGPHAGYLAVKDIHKRQLPGRLVGVSKDRDGAVAYRLALQTREQHIRREKATSNICTAQVLLAVMAAAYAVYHGPEGLTRIAERIHRHAVELATRLSAHGISLSSTSFFDTVELTVPGGADRALAGLLSRNITAWRVDDKRVRLSCDERTTESIIDDIVDALVDTSVSGSEIAPALPPSLARSDEFLTHPTFHRYRTETLLMRYLKSLADKDYALDRGMIPLGSCTMKLNSAIEMAAITWPGFASIHPFAPAQDRAGYRELVVELESWLSAATGYDGVSLQPNAGSQGELAGLLAIRGYHLSRGDTARHVCLIPASAHGTNAASAVLAGFTVVVVATAADGSIDLNDLDAKIAAHRDQLGAIMITYPSTHGIYEDTVGDVCARVHEAGGQVYIDGANLNALVGVARPGDFGGDVSHLNLHKTFAIPHGGGGPGVGPVAARAHLVPFLPSHPLSDNTVTGSASRHAPGFGAVSQAPDGSAGILPISYAYLLLMGGEGLRVATQSAILAANYVAARLDKYLPVLYRGPGGLVGHECIIDVRPLRDETGITVDDVAKRLVDYGFHAPTMSFPVPGTLMIEPTESEDRGEIDRLCEALIGIHDEARRVAEGDWPADDNPLVNAPHTAAHALVGEWTHPYSREQAVYPSIGSDVLAEPGLAAAAAAGKYWPPVRRIDGPYGDRNLVCSCPPIEDYV